MDFPKFSRNFTGFDWIRKVSLFFFVKLGFAPIVVQSASICLSNEGIRDR